jgi:hypothetical protein
MANHSPLISHNNSSAQINGSQLRVPLKATSFYERGDAIEDTNFVFNRSKMMVSKASDIALSAQQARRSNQFIDSEFDKTD